MSQMSQMSQKWQWRRGPRGGQWRRASGRGLGRPRRRGVWRGACWACGAPSPPPCRPTSTFPSAAPPSAAASASSSPATSATSNCNSTTCAAACPSSSTAPSTATDSPFNFVYVSFRVFFSIVSLFLFPDFSEQIKLQSYIRDASWSEDATSHWS